MSVFQMQYLSHFQMQIQFSGFKKIVLQNVNGPSYSPFYKATNFLTRCTKKICLHYFLFTIEIENLRPILHILRKLDVTTYLLDHCHILEKSKITFHNIVDTTLFNNFITLTY